MEYKGKLYAKIWNKYLEISHTDEFEKLDQSNSLLIQETESLKRACDIISGTNEKLEADCRKHEVDNKRMIVALESIRMLINSDEIPSDAQVVVMTDKIINDLLNNNLK